MVVVAQVGRRRANERVAERLNDVLGVREWTGGSGLWNTWLVVMLVVLIAATVICLIRVELRVVAALLVTHAVLVMSTPMWFLHYAGLTAAPVALTLGGALATVMAWGRPVRWVPRVLVGIAVAGTLLLAYPMKHVDLGDMSFPAERLASRISDRDGCITTDWPMTLIQMNLLQRDIDHGCRFVVDLGGYSYYLVDSPFREQPRRLNEDWQVLALTYYRSGAAVLVVRFDTDRGFSEQTAETLDSWPVIVKADGYVVRRPDHDS